MKNLVNITFEIPLSSLEGLKTVHTRDKGKNISKGYYSARELEDTNSDKSPSREQIFVSHTFPIMDRNPSNFFQEELAQAIVTQDKIYVEFEKARL